MTLEVFYREVSLVSQSHKSSICQRVSSRQSFRFRQYVVFSNHSAVSIDDTVFRLYLSAIASFNRRVIGYIPKSQSPSCRGLHPVLHHSCLRWFVRLSSMYFISSLTSYTGPSNRPSALVRIVKKGQKYLL